MALPKAYGTFADFEREEIRPAMRIGWSMDEIHAPHEQVLDFDLDETALRPQRPKTNTWTTDS
jgi:hypothetical protein